MTVTYTHEVATGKGFGNFWRLLGRWRGSIYKVVVPELIVYAIFFGTINLTYRLWIKHEPYRKEMFEKWVKYCADYAGVIPVSFVLGFYVSQIVTRWWNQFMTIPWPDPIAAMMATTFHGTDDQSRLMKRTVMRYINLAFVMTMVMISPQAKSRFPTIEHLVMAGFMLPHEKQIFDRLNARSDLPKYWVPLVWAGNIVGRARQENRVREDLSMINILQGIAKFRGGCGDLLAYDWVCVPLVYTQVVTLAVYLYFTAALFGKQFIENDHELVFFYNI
ncbi:bestrophin-2 [Folsomia candida]|uniref:bestrophin-2 n=1 Tax=Folsomia candida TaxID=158441 RepID=UPI001604CF27|nr:bestrophin-2 [Folsomia candida]